eukprot:8124496-Pyramimonas_sp.AAC.1
MRHRHPLRHTPHTVRGLIGSSTEGPSGCGCMRHRNPLRHTPHAVRDPIGSSTDGPQWVRLHASPPHITAHPSRGSWPHREFHRRPQ